MGPRPTEDAAELDPLEQRLVDVGGKIEDALVEIDTRARG
jgi:hypothetical protein